MKEKVSPYLACIGMMLVCFFYTMHIYKPGQVNKSVVCGIILWIAVIYLGMVQRIEKKVAIEKIAIMFVGGIGALYFLFMPRFAVPDEDGHFMRSYEISIGNFLSENNELGGHSLVPEGFDLWKEYQKTGEGNVYELQKEYSDNVISDEVHEMFNPNQALYSPFAYIPQSLGIFVARLFTKNAVCIFYAGRLAMYIFALIIIYFSIKIIPAGKRTILIICAFPMFMQEMISYSCDALINVSSIFLLAYILYVNEKNGKITFKDKVIILITCFIISMCKIVYLPFVLAVFLLSKDKFTSDKGSILYKIIVTLFSVAMNLLWLAISSAYLIETNPGVDPFGQVKYVLTHPFTFVITIFRTIALRGPMWAGTMAGCVLGRLIVRVSYVAIVVVLILVVIDLFLISKDEKINISIKGKLLIAFILLAIMMLTFASLYVQWTPYKQNIIDGVQGRYFIPFICWIAFVLKKKKINVDNHTIIKYYLPVLFVVNYCAIISLYTFFVS